MKKAGGFFGRLMERINFGFLLYAESRDSIYRGASELRIREAILVC